MKYQKNGKKISDFFKPKCCEAKRSKPAVIDKIDLTDAVEVSTDAVEVSTDAVIDLTISESPEPVSIGVERAAGEVQKNLKRASLALEAGALAFGTNGVPKRSETELLRCPKKNVERRTASLRDALERGYEALTPQEKRDIDEILECVSS